MEALTSMALVILIGATVIALLPASPFTLFIDSIGNIPYIDYINWFIPISTFIAIGEAWLLCVATYYLASILLRHIKAVGS